MNEKQMHFLNFHKPKTDAFDGSVDGFFTDPRDADKLALFARTTNEDIVLEPCAGHGSLVHSLMRLPEPPRKIIAYEQHPPFFNRLKEECSVYGERVELRFGDFFRSSEKFSVCVMNPPYKKFLDIRFVEHALTQCGRVIALLWSNSLFNKKRALVWNSSHVTRINLLANRPRPFLRGDKKQLKPMRDYIMIECMASPTMTSRLAHQCEIVFDCE